MNAWRKQYMGKEEVVREKTGLEKIKKMKSNHTGGQEGGKRK